MRTPAASAAPPVSVLVTAGVSGGLKAALTRSCNVSGAAAGLTVFLALSSSSDLGSDGVVSVSTMTPPVGYTND